MADLRELTVGDVLDLINLRYRDIKRQEKDAKNPPARKATQADIDRYL